MVNEIELIKDEDILRDISSLADAFKVLEAQGVAATDIRDLGTGFTVLKEKDQLVGVQMLILGYRFHEGDNGEFVIAYVVTEEDGASRKLIVVDGGSGIYNQLKLYSEKGIKSIYVPEGLTRSDYTYMDESTGKERPATTYYLSS